MLLNFDLSSCDTSFFKKFAWIVAFACMSLHLTLCRLTNILEEFLMHYGLVVVVSKGPFRAGSGEVGMGGGVGISVCRPVLCRAVLCRHGWGGQRGLVPRNAYYT